MGVQVGHGLTRQLCELRRRRHAHPLAAVRALPQRDGRAPEAVAADGPIARLFEPIAKALLTHGLGHPVDAFVVLGHRITQLLDADKPHRGCLVNERGTRAPTVRITVLDRGVLEDQAAALERLDDRRVRLLDVDARVVGHRRHEAALLVDGVDGRDADLAACLEVVLAKRGRHVHKPRAVGGGDVARRDHGKCRCRCIFHKIVEQRLIAQSHERAARQRRQHLGRFAEHLGAQVGGHDVHAAVLAARAHVVHRVTDRDREVARQGPRRGGPHEQARVVDVIDQLEAHGECRVVHVAVVEVGLEVRQGRRQSPRKRHHAHALVDEVLLPQLAEHPPDALHE